MIVFNAGCDIAAARCAGKGGFVIECVIIVAKGGSFLMFITHSILGSRCRRPCIIHLNSYQSLVKEENGFGLTASSTYIYTS